MAFLEGKFFEKNDASLTVQNTISRVDSPNISDPSNDILDLKEDVKKNIDLLSLRQETKDALANLDTRIENIFDTYHLYSNQDRVGLQEKFNASPEAHMLRRELVNLVERQEKDKINAVRNYQFKLNNLQQEIISGGQTPDLSNSSPKINSYFAEGTTNRISTAFSYIQTDN